MVFLLYKQRHSRFMCGIQTQANPMYG